MKDYVSFIINGEEVEIGELSKQMGSKIGRTEITGWALAIIAITLSTSLIVPWALMNKLDERIDKLDEQLDELGKENVELRIRIEQIK